MPTRRHKFKPHIWFNGIWWCWVRANCGWDSSHIDYKVVNLRNVAARKFVKRMNDIVLNRRPA